MQHRAWLGGLNPVRIASKSRELRVLPIRAGVAKKYGAEIGRAPSCRHPRRIPWQAPRYPPARSGFFVELSASPTTLAVGGTTTLTATTGTDVGPTPCFIDIYDTTSGKALRFCGLGTTCSATISQSTATTHTFVAYVALVSTVLPPAQIQATSNTSYVTWTNSGLRLSLTGPEVVIDANGPGSFTATASVDVRTTS